MLYEERTFHDLHYCFFAPDDFAGGRRYPVILSTHGAGGRGRDLEILRQGPVVRDLKPHLGGAILIAPQCYADTWFDIFGELMALAEYLHTQPYTDPRRFYSLGVSMGGYAAYQLMMSRPALFAGALVCCGGGMYWNAARLAHIPMRIFHGERDTVVYSTESVYMAEAIRRAGGVAELTLYPDLDHNCWDRALSDEANIRWLLEKERDHDTI